jgi:FKBP-type peptidyl-prolyl cis-trans isomerase FkpA
MQSFVPFLAIGLLFGLASCGNKPIEGTTPGGFTYYKYTNAQGERPEVGDKVLFHETVMLGRDSTFVSQLREEVLPPRDQVYGAAPNYEVIFLLSPGDSVTTFVTGEDMEAYGMNAEDTLFFHIGFKEIVARKEEVKAQQEAKRIENEQRQNENNAKAEEIAQMVQATLADFKKGNLSKTIKKTSSGLQYIIHEEGEGPLVQANDQVKAHYYGVIMATGNHFDNSYAPGNPIPVTVGVGQVIPGWDEGLQLLRKGGKASFFIPGKIAYGAQEVGPIPANADLMFFVELVDINP